MSGTIVTSAPRPTSSSASGLDSGRVTMMRLPASGCSATDLLQDTVGSRSCAPHRRASLRAPWARRHPRRERRRGRPEKRLTPAYAHYRHSRSRRMPQPVRCSPRRASRETHARRSSPRAHAGRRSRRGARGSRSSPSRHWTASAPCPGAGSIVSGSSHSLTATFEPEAPDTGGGQERAVVLALAHLADPRVHVPADRARLEIGPERPELCLAPQAARADDCTRFEVAEGEPVTRHEAVADVARARRRRRSRRRLRPRSEDP